MAEEIEDAKAYIDAKFKGVEEMLNKLIPDEPKPETKVEIKKEVEHHVPSTMKFCPECNMENPDYKETEEECPECYAPVDPSWKACPTCGERLDEEED